MRYLLTVILLLGLQAGACSSRPEPEQKLRVAAAADLTHAFTELAKEFKTKTGITVEIEYGASGLLATKIQHGEPFALFAAANRAFVDLVVEAGQCDGATARAYARGRLVVWTRAGIAPPASLTDLTHERFEKIAIANPDQSPYGKAAKQTLETAGIWPQIASRVVLGENVAATMQTARNGDVQAALVAMSLAAVADGGASLPIDPAMHAPIDQAMVVCGKGAERDAAKQFADFVGSSEGNEVMTRYGFTLPGPDVGTAYAPPKSP